MSLLWKGLTGTNTAGRQHMPLLRRGLRRLLCCLLEVTPLSAGHRRQCGRMSGDLGSQLVRLACGSHVEQVSGITCVLCRTLSTNDKEQQQIRGNFVLWPKPDPNSTFGREHVRLPSKLRRRLQRALCCQHVLARCVVGMRRRRRCVHGLMLQ